MTSLPKQDSELSFLINFGDYPKFTMISERLTSNYFINSPSVQKTVLEKDCIKC